MFESNYKDEEGFHSFIAKRLFETRTLTLFGEIKQNISREISEQLLVLASHSDEPIKLLINSPGGHVESADTIFDLIQSLNTPVYVIGTGWVASAGALIFAAPPKERRFSLPNTRYLLHQPSGGVGGQATDISIEAREIIKMRKRLNTILAKQTGQPLEKIEKDTDRNFWMSVNEAIEYGLVGKVVKSLRDVK